MNLLMIEELDASGMTLCIRTFRPHNHQVLAYFVPEPPSFEASFRGRRRLPLVEQVENVGARADAASGGLLC